MAGTRDGRKYKGRSMIVYKEKKEKQSLYKGWKEIQGRGRLTKREKKEKQGRYKGWKEI